MNYHTKNFLLKTFYHLWPKIIFPKAREHFKWNARRVTVDQRKQEMGNDGGDSLKKVDPYAFIRVKNERRTLLASLNSILPAIKKGVIAYNIAPGEETDGSEKLIEQFCRENPGFIPFHYPYHVEPPNSPKYATGELAFENTLGGYYQATLEQIPKNEWLIKIDVDELFLPQALAHSFSIPKTEQDIVIYSRLDVVRTSTGQIKIERYLRSGDQWLVFNKDLRFENVVRKRKDGSLFACEHLIKDNSQIPYSPECSILHFMYEKQSREYRGDLSKLENLEDFLKRADPSEFSDELLTLRDMAKHFEKA